MFDQYLFYKRYEMKKNRMGMVIIVLAILLCVTIGIATSFGAANIAVSDCFKIIGSKLPGIRKYITMDGIKEVYPTIILQVRLPRIIMAAIVGCGLSIVGAAFQSLFRNPLADPHVLGVSSGAALGATIAMLSGITFRIGSLGMIGIFAFLGAIITVFIVYSLAGVGGKHNITSVLLTGTAISTMLSAFISLLMSLHEDEIEKVYMWTLGSFSSATWGKIRFLSIFVFLGVVVIIILANDLNVILTGEDSAKSLGIDTIWLKRLIILVASLLVGACVSVSGIIGFVGLIIPHATRLIAGPDHRKLLPYCCFTGAIFMVISDTVARCIIQPSELPVGVITALFGAPYFILLLYLNQRKISRQ